MSLQSKLWIYRVAFLLVWSLGILFLCRKPVKECDFTGSLAQVDTLYIHDTVTYEKPVYLTTTRVNTEYVPVLDTVWVRDTLCVPIVMEKRVYGDSRYRAEVSGYKPSLDFIEVYPKTTIITKVESVTKRNALTFGISASYCQDLSLPVGMEYERMVYSGVYLNTGVFYDLRSDLWGVSLGIEVGIDW